MQSVGIFHARVPCRRCSATNTVDLRRAGLGRRARCGRCGDPLPRRVPAPLVMAAGTLVVVLLGVAYVVAGELAERREAERVERIGLLVEQGRAEEAVPLLQADRESSTPEGELARRVAESLAAPVVAVASDPHAGLATIDEALARADRLVEELCPERRCRLPELVDLLDRPSRALQARAAAQRIMVRAEALASAADPDLESVERALDDARLLAVEAPSEVTALAQALEPQVRARAVLGRARRLVARSPADAQALVRDGARGIAAPRLTRVSAAAEPPEDLAGRPLLEQAAAVRRAVAERDRAALAQLVLLRPAASWDASQAGELAREVRRACEALASLEADRARAAADSQERVEALVRAMTCDETLPAPFLREARAALASALLEDGRAGREIESAVAAWAALDVPERDHALAAAACHAESRGQWALALRAWSLVGSRATFATLADCAEATAAAPRVAAPALEYPALPVAG